ncbi:MAG: 50S ribosomal protein L29 [Anaerolineales bacterium]
MKPDEIRELSTEEIQARLDEAREELMNLRFQQSTGELIDTTRLPITRRNIARFMTILNERKREAEMEGEA